ncbi:TetR/AcrR family transcriptional regulator [Streptomyces mirabilis]|uniref:TetR/AcrR family transcriptional regulator n=1 Tax=Streptomyces mirabilis TaxID=68239 RepID=UPI0036901BBD
MSRQHSRRQLVSNELLEHAARLFASQGYANTSFQDIADSMGISRPALYHYVSNKEEILAALVRDVLERVVEILQQARAREDMTEDARVEEALRQIIVNNARNTARFRLLDRSEPDLPVEIAEMHRQARRRVLELLTELVEDSIRAGYFRPLPARTVALGLLGMANWVAWWYRSDADGDAESVAGVLVDLAMAGVRRDNKRQVRPGPWAALALLKEDIAHLEVALLSAKNEPTADSAILPALSVPEGDSAGARKSSDIDGNPPHSSQ